MWYSESKTLWPLPSVRKTMDCYTWPQHTWSQHHIPTGRTKPWNGQELCRNSKRCGHGCIGTRHMTANTMFSMSPNLNQAGEMNAPCALFPKKESARSARVCGTLDMAVSVPIRNHLCAFGGKPRLPIPTSGPGMLANLLILPVAP